jgi:hypothetical protein
LLADGTRLLNLHRIRMEVEINFIATIYLLPYCICICSKKAIEVFQNNINEAAFAQAEGLPAKEKAYLK